MRIGNNGPKAFFDDEVTQQRCIHSGERCLACEQLIHDDSESVHVCLRVGCSAFQQLRGGVMQRVLQRGGAVRFRGHDCSGAQPLNGSAEVAYFGCKVGREQHVHALQVAVRYFALVQELDGRGDFARYSEAHVPWEGVGVLPAESLKQVPAAHPFHHEKRISSVLASGKERDAVRVFDAGHDGQLTNELLELFFGERTSVFGDFDGHNFAIKNSLMHNCKPTGFGLGSRVQLDVVALDELEPVF